MMKNPKVEEESIINDVRNLLDWKKMKKETLDTTIKHIKSLFRLET